MLTVWISFTSHSAYETEGLFFMSYKTIEPRKMLQQRKHAWTERKKKPKREMSPNKGNLNSDRVFPSYLAKNYYKVSACRHHEAGKVPYSDVPYNNISTRGSSIKKMSLSQSQFLPPILAVSGDCNLSLPHRQSSLGEGSSTRGLVNTDVWKLQVKEKTVNKDLKQCASQKEVGSEPYFGGRPSQALQLVPSCWDQQTIALQDSEDLSKQHLKSSTPDIYRTCLLVIAPRKPDKESNVQQTAGRGTVTGGSRSQRRLLHKCFPTWRNREESHQAIKAEDKLSSRDSAFGTDSSCEIAGIDLGLEMFKAEMNHFTQQRIIDWILEVNDALFSSHSTEASKCSLTEQDTSIKFVYEGDE